MHGNRFIGVEFEEVEAAEGRGVLVLLADGFAEQADFDVACLFGEGPRWLFFPLVGVQDVEEAHGEGAAAAQARALAGDVGQGKQFDAGVDARGLHAGVEQRVPDLLAPVDDFGLRVPEADAFLEALVGDEVNVLVDGRAQDRAAVPRVIVFEVGAATAKAYPQGRPTGDQYVYLIATKRFEKGI